MSQPSTVSTASADPTSSPPSPPRARRRVAALLAGVALALLSAGVIALLLGALRPAPPAVRLVSARVHGVTVEGVVMRVALRVRNPNRVALQVRGFDARVTVEGHPLGSPRATASLTRIAGRSEVPLDIEMVAPWSDAISVGLASLQKTELGYVIDGDVRIGTGRVSVGYPVRVQGTFPSRMVRDAIPNSLPFGLPGLLPQILRPANPTR